MYFKVGQRINLFQGIVGKLQPILSRLPKKLEEYALERRLIKKKRDKSWSASWKTWSARPMNLDSTSTLPALTAKTTPSFRSLRSHYLTSIAFCRQRICFPRVLRCGLLMRDRTASSCPGWKMNSASQQVAKFFPIAVTANSCFRREIISSTRLQVRLRGKLKTSRALVCVGLQRERMACNSFARRIQVFTMCARLPS